MTIENRLMRSLVWALFFTAFVTPYMSLTQWWKFAPATLVMLLCQAALHPSDWYQRLGLAISQRTLWRAAALLLGVAVATHFGVHHIATHTGGVLVGSAWGPYRLLPFCQVLNEEMLFRALLLGTCARRGCKPAYVSWLAAASFAFAHVAIYRWGIAHTWLLPQTIAVLLCFALVTNAMYLRTGNIAYPVAVHLGWNFTRFGAFWQFPDTPWQTAEACGFNTFEAHPSVVCVALLGCTIALGAAGWLPWSRADEAHLGRAP